MPRVLIMALRAGRPEHSPEAEPVIVDTDFEGAVVIELDDGERLEFAASEIRSALEEAA
jgi:hypothetical protein